ncbi:uncharacterized protein EI90DRAFT_3027658 [Cantharellus anzutake]|uniref:uncharacterized protein n=1 Tax=Cantharellus anzutake TaxID=1750568 RepID=UPI001905BB18|nr:uncharacterized protein EI90DRAFT_3027658 [Cantharellus anzutake]KAF8343951.1 hypothetical protein EI90DRAFT_3027658 [Cantharellus anzutake]
MAAIYTVFTSPSHAPIPNHLPTLIVTPHGQPSNILYSYLHTNFNAENYLLTPSPQGDLCVAKMFPPNRNAPGAKSAASDPGHSSGAASRAVRCEASRNLKWTIANTGVMSPIYKLSLPSPNGPDLPLFQVSKPNPNATFWSMFYFAYAGHLIPPKRIEFGKIQKNPPGPGGGGTRISITGKTPEEKAVWQTLGEGNEDCVEWVVLCAALNLLDDEILKAAEKAGPPPVSIPPQLPATSRPVNGQPVPVRQGSGSQQRPHPQHQPPPQSLQPSGRPPQMPSQQQQPQYPNGARGPPSGVSVPYAPNGQQRIYNPNQPNAQNPVSGQQIYPSQQALPRPQQQHNRPAPMGGYIPPQQNFPSRAGTMPLPGQNGSAQPVRRI